MIKILYSPYAVEVYSDSGGFAGGITRRRMESQDASHDVAEALQAILDGLGMAAMLVDDTAVTPGFIYKGAKTPRPS